MTGLHVLYFFNDSPVGFHEWTHVQVHYQALVIPSTVSSYDMYTDSCRTSQDGRFIKLADGTTSLKSNCNFISRLLEKLKKINFAVAKVKKKSYY